jgi:phosphopantothenoylcysteine decarboxylase/phosphopantothenate--cysteine ligase
MSQKQTKQSILFIISGGIAAYKALETIRLFKKQGFTIRTILTKGGAEFVTPLSIQALTEEKVYQELWDLTDEHEMGHIELSRSADLILVAPATAHIIARMAHGMADDLATTCLLATDTPVMIAPAMNVRMWEHDATQKNIAILKKRGIDFIGPNEGDMACGEYGPGRMAEPTEIAKAVTDYFKTNKTKSETYTPPLKEKKALVTAGPTHEAIDPVRFIGNYSSGKQGYAIARALKAAGADVTLISGPTNLDAPSGINIINVKTADEMLKACEQALPADIGIFTAAVSDWRIAQQSDQKIKKQDGKSPTLQLSENPDILKTICAHKNRPALTIGFAAETEKLHDNAKAKRLKKGCDWIVANEISVENPVFGQDHNRVSLISAERSEDWKPMDKSEIAEKLVEKISDFFYKNKSSTQLKAV